MCARINKSVSLEWSINHGCSHPAICTATIVERGFDDNPLVVSSGHKMLLLTVAVYMTQKDEFDEVKFFVSLL